MPVDVTKTRMQLGGAAGVKAYRGMVHCVTTTVRHEGISALWKGLEPALWRQATYGSVKRQWHILAKTFEHVPSAREPKPKPKRRCPFRPTPISLHAMRRRPVMRMCCVFWSLISPFSLPKHVSSSAHLCRL